MLTVAAKRHMTERKPSSEASLEMEINPSMYPNGHDFKVVVINVKQQSNHIFELIQMPQPFYLDITGKKMAVGIPKSKLAAPEKPVALKLHKNAPVSAPSVLTCVAKLENVEQDISKFVSRSENKGTGNLAAARTGQHKSCSQSFPTCAKIHGKKSQAPKNLTSKQSIKVPHSKSERTMRITRSRRKLELEEELLKCQLCDETCKSRTHLVRHLKTHVDKLSYRCPVCPRMFETKLGMAVHVKSHVEKIKYECEICAKFYKRKSDILRHMKLHIKAMEHKTRIPTMYIRKGKKMQAGGGGHAGKDRRRPLKIKNQMLKKEKLHAGESKHKCEICGEVFRNRMHMLKHLKVHAEKSKYECNVCSKTFKWRQSILHASEEKKNPDCSSILAESLLHKINIASDTMEQSAIANEYHPDFYLVDVKTEPADSSIFLPTVKLEDISFFP